MTALVVGGAASGKSQLAEQLILQSTARPRVYIATMQVWDSESERRVQKHRAMRAEKQFSTLEVPLGLLAAAESVPPGSAVLLEDLTNLCAGEMFSPQGAGENTEKAISAGRVAFKAENAEYFSVPREVDRIYFFNPFSLEILQKVIHRILESYYEKPREIKLLFYYPSDEYISYLMTVDEFMFEDEIDCRDLFPGNDMRERIVIFGL